MCMVVNAKESSRYPLHAEVLQGAAWSPMLLTYIHIHQPPLQVRHSFLLDTTEDCSIKGGMQTGCRSD